MDNSFFQQHPTAAGTASGVLLVFCCNITSAELLKTILLAAVGAVVSFAVSWCMSRWLKKNK
jgi:mannitol-specific phosphotransferase system IIBC component